MIVSCGFENKNVFYLSTPERGDSKFALNVGFKKAKGYNVYYTEKKSIVAQLKYFWNQEITEIMKDWKPRDNKADRIPLVNPVDSSLKYMDHQVDGINFALSVERALIGDAPGVGKSIQAAGYILSLWNYGFKRIIVPCPAAMTRTLKREFKKWTGIDAVICDKNTVFAGNNVYIMTFDRMRLSHAKIKQWNPQVIVADEAHYLKNPDAKRTKVMQDLVQSAERVLFMTGTPCPNSIKESFHMFNILDEDRFPTALYHERNLEQYHKEIMIRRRIEDVFDMPPKIRQFIHLDGNIVSEEIRTELESCLKEQLDFSIKFEDFSRARREAALKKLDLIQDILLDSLEEALNENSKLIVFAYHIEVIEMIKQLFESKGLNTVAYHSKMTQQQRDEVDIQFQSGDAQVMVSSIRAGGVGRTLTASRFGVFAELDYIPANIEQAEARIYRYGSKAPVLIKYPIIENSFDELMLDILFKKQYDVNRIVYQTNL